MFQKSLERQGASPRQWRILIAVLLAPFAIIAFLNSGWMTQSFGPWGEEAWDFFCLSLAFAGLATRTTIAGYGQGIDVESRTTAMQFDMTGFYSIVRHPTYIANFLILLSGILLFKSAVFTTLAAVVALLYYERLTLSREKLLLDTHGETFRGWAEYTPAFLPKFSQWRAPAEPFSFQLALRREAVTLAFIGLMFFTIEALEAVIVEQHNFFLWVLHEAHWATLLAISLGIVAAQLSRVWSILLFVVSSLALGSIGFARTMLPLAHDHREEALRALSVGGHVLLMRHGSTVGRDDEQVDATDCTTQRNLGDKGREEALYLGRLLRERGVKLAKVISSQYCRTQETAGLVSGTTPETWSPLNEKKMHVTLVERLIGNFEKDEVLLRPVREVISEWRGDGTLLIVSHAPNIAGLTFEDMDPADALVLRPAPYSKLGFAVIGKIARSQ
jgi:protein-S-isoprenylcysteine O-methyltransferase Ste14/phosphohistidine phosphatase SixA